jgi:hypothetical protein
MYVRLETLVLSFFMAAFLFGCGDSSRPYGKNQLEIKQFYQKYDQVHIGMTRAKVSELLGEPDMAESGISIAEKEELEKSGKLEKSNGFKILGLEIGGRDITPTAETWIYLYPSSESTSSNPAVSFDLKKNIVNKLHTVDQ